jgi:hypothetical protein
MKLHNVFPQTLKLIVVTLGCLLLIGCVGFVTQAEPSEEVSLLFQKSKELKLGLTKTEVHSIVGVPHISSEHLKFDLFQVVSERKEHAIAILPPLWVYKNKDYTVVLFVTYHDDWTVKDYKWELYDESKKRDRDSVLIMLDGYTLVRTEPKLTGTMLIAPAEVSEKALIEPLQGDGCVLHLAVPNQPVALEDTSFQPSLIKLFINEKLLISLEGIPYSGYLPQKYWEGKISDTVFIGFQLPEGVHELELRAYNKKDSIKASFTCVSGKVNYAHVRAEVIDVENEEGWKLFYSYRLKGEIYISESMPKEIKDRRQILIYRDVWYGLDYQK